MVIPIKGLSVKERERRMIGYWNGREIMGDDIAQLLDDWRGNRLVCIGDLVAGKPMVFVLLDSLPDSVPNEDEFVNKIEGLLNPSIFNGEVGTTRKEKK
jgi:hypothetical protein